MRSVVEVETRNPDQISKIISKSLESDKNVNYSIETEEDRIIVETVTEGLGALRGCTDTVFRLVTLAEKTYYR